DDARNRERALNADADDASVGVWCLDGPRGEGVAARRDVVCVQGSSRDMTDSALVGLADADDGILWTFRQGAHAPTSSCSAAWAENLSTACESMMLRYSLLARLSLLGGPSPAREAAAACAVWAVLGWPTSSASVLSPRIGVAATRPRPTRARVMMPFSVSIAN